MNENGHKPGCTAFTLLGVCNCGPPTPATTFVFGDGVAPTQGEVDALRRQVATLTAERDTKAAYVDRLLAKVGSARDAERKVVQMHDVSLDGLERARNERDQLLGLLGKMEGDRDAAQAACGVSEAGAAAIRVEVEALLDRLDKEYSAFDLSHWVRRNILCVVNALATHDAGTALLAELSAARDVVTAARAVTETSGAMLVGSKRESAALRDALAAFDARRAQVYQTEKGR